MENLIVDVYKYTELSESSKEFFTKKENLIILIEMAITEPKIDINNVTSRFLDNSCNAIKNQFITRRILGIPIEGKDDKILPDISKPIPLLDLIMSFVSGPDVKNSILCRNFYEIFSSIICDYKILLKYIWKKEEFLHKIILHSYQESINELIPYMLYTKNYNELNFDELADTQEEFLLGILLVLNQDAELYVDMGNKALVRILRYSYNMNNSVQEIIYEALFEDINEDNVTNYIPILTAIMDKVIEYNENKVATNALHKCINVVWLNMVNMFHMLMKINFSDFKSKHKVEILNLLSKIVSVFEIVPDTAGFSIFITSILDTLEENYKNDVVNREIFNLLKNLYVWKDCFVIIRNIFMEFISKHGKDDKKNFYYKNSKGAVVRKENCWVYVVFKILTFFYSIEHNMLFCDVEGKRWDKFANIIMDIGDEWLMNIAGNHKQKDSISFFKDFFGDIHDKPNFTTVMMKFGERRTWLDKKEPVQVDVQPEFDEEIKDADEYMSILIEEKKEEEKIQLKNEKSILFSEEIKQENMKPIKEEIKEEIKQEIMKPIKEEIMEPIKEEITKPIKEEIKCEDIQHPLPDVTSPIDRSFLNVSMDFD